MTGSPSVRVGSARVQWSFEADGRRFRIYGSRGGGPGGGGGLGPARDTMAPLSFALPGAFQA